MLCQFLVLFVYIFVVISSRPPIRFLPNLPDRWQMDCNRKVKLFSELFRGGRSVQKGHFRFGPSFRKCSLATKRDLLTGRIISLPNVENRVKICQWMTERCIWREMVSGAPRRSVNYVNINMETLDSQHCHRAILIV